VPIIPLTSLVVAFVPVVVVLLILYHWSLNAGFATYALARMLLQLLAVGYVLAYVFQADQPWIVLVVLTTMLGTASWIALRPLSVKGRSLYGKALASITLGGVLTLVLVTQAVLRIDPWFDPSRMIPLAGMIFASAMNTISIAAERLQAEIQRDATYEEARCTAIGAALIPLFNSLLAVGLVSLPGMMTGQILSGVDPLIAARYQIVVMCMIFGSSGISSACFLTMLRPAKADRTPVRRATEGSR
jgi:UDP-glucose/iron transport system permease protein